MQMPFLAQYTIRSKQAYIFRTNAMQEIAGASILISKAWDVLFNAADKAGLKTQRLDAASDAFPEDPAEALAGGCNMVDLFRGGGNDTVLFDSRDSFVKANRAFSRALFEDCPGMLPLFAGVETTRNYTEDYSRLMEAMDAAKNRMNSAGSCAMLPFSMMDRKTFQPITTIYKGEELTAEAAAKRKCYDKSGKKDDSVACLDDIISSTRKSLLAVIHADGNNMGVKIQKLLQGKSGYAECIPLMRQFTRSTAEVFSGEGIAFPKAAKLRWVVNDGDDATLVCEAKYAETIAERYLSAVSERSALNGEFKYSACAGIVIFHSHFPFASAYSLAEEACSSAKKKVHVASAEPIEEAWMDFHFIHSGSAGELEAIRSAHGTADRMARPIGVICSEKEPFTARSIRALYSAMAKHGVTRTNIKTVGREWELNKHGGTIEMERLYFRAPGLKEELEALFGSDAECVLKAVYDLSEVLDIEWFKPEEAEV